MTKTLRLVVAIVVGKVLIFLGAVVPSQFQETFTVAGLAVLRNALLSRVAEEVEVESCTGSLVSSEQGHAQDLLVELEGLLGILDADHGVVLVRVSTLIKLKVRVNLPSGR